MEVTVRKELTALRAQMTACGLTACLIPTTDYHHSEYVNDHFKFRAYVSGFDGSAGTLLMLRDSAFLWTDGRYFLQAASQLAGSGIQLMKMEEPGVPEIPDFLRQHLVEGDCLGFDGRLTETKIGRQLTEIAAQNGASCKTDIDLADRLWTDRPALEASAICALPLSTTGKSAAEKLRDLRHAMDAQRADWHLLTRLEEIAWLFNLRGRDVANTPVFYAFALISQTQARLYVLDQSLAARWPQEAAVCGIEPAAVTLLPYAQIFDDIHDLSGNILLDEDYVSFALTQAIRLSGAEILAAKNPIDLMKAIKNPVEIACTRNAHLKDGAAMVNFLCWLKENIGKQPLTEIAASDYLEACRRAQPGCFDLSFETICGYLADGAIIHYTATPQSDKALAPAGFLLVDSGGQYLDGTTDITRTIALGPLTETMKRHYTAVLKCHIALATARFTPGSKAIELDRLTRAPLQAIGLDYKHGTGHGIGHLLCVHESPNTINTRNETAEILPGMITSNEPGVYLEGEYGIRLENEILCVDGADGLRAFETITYCPFEPEAILPDELTDAELNWLNTYHQQVRTALTPLLAPKEKQWLDQATAPLTRQS